MANQKLIYDVGDRPKLKNLFLYSFQLLLAILAATVAFPVSIGLPIQIPSAILGAGVGTIVYILFTKRKSPIVVSSSFSFLSAFPTAISFGYLGILLGGLFSGLVYVFLALIIKLVGTKWVAKLMPPVIVGPIVTLIGLSLAPNAINDLVSANSAGIWSSYNLVAILCGLITLFTIVICTVQNKFKSLKLVPFIIGIGAGIVVASIFTGIGIITNCDYIKIVDWSPLINNFTPVSVSSFIDYPRVIVVEAFKEMINGNYSEAIIAANGGVNPHAITGAGVLTIIIAFCPIALVSFAEHLADHKNMSSILNHDLINDDPKLHRTLLGDGVGSIMGTFFGVCPNTSYGEGIACIALTRNASVITTFTTACICVALSFLVPFSAALQSIPRCVMGGVCLTLYGYISVSGFKMIKVVDLDDNINLLTICVILITGIGRKKKKIPYQIGIVPEECKYLIVSDVATALLLGVAVFNLSNLIVKGSTNIVPEVNPMERRDDLVRTYLKQFGVEKLTQGLGMFGLKHENIDSTVTQLSNILRSKEVLGLRKAEELFNIIILFSLHGYQDGMNKKQLIDLIVYDCSQIDAKMIRQL